MTSSANEAIAFFETMAATPDDAVTACEEWRAHELVAHVAAGAAEMAGVVEAHLRGDPVPPTRAFAVREAPYRALPERELRDRLATEGARLIEALASLHRDGEATVPFSGREMTAARFETHARSELALHRWDLAGDDDTSMELLSQPDLTEHAIAVLNAFSALAECPVARARRAGLRDVSFEARLQCDGRPDVVVSIAGRTASFAFDEEGRDVPGLRMSPAARLLLLWGRRPGGAHRIRSEVPAEDVALLRRLLHA